MRLYKTELFKLFYNKIFKIGMLATTGLLFLYFWFAEVGGEIATVDGKFYSGYEAVQINRKITKEFEGDLTDEKVNQIIEKYGLPANKPIFIYGGNMGKPQGIPFLIECMEAVCEREDCHFAIVGNGTEYPRLETFMLERKPKSVSLFKHLPKEDYDRLAKACDIGLIFLDYRFTIPNYPSRLLPYLMERKPIIAVTDPICDMGTLAEENGYGFYCPSNSIETFVKSIDKMLVSDIRQMGENGYQFFLDNYTTEHTYETIMKHIE